jgi:hypothetical protein
MTGGQAAYEAYFLARDGDHGCWAELTDDQRACWEAAATAAIGGADWHAQLAGTERGHRRHQRYGEPSCSACREAYNRAAAARRRARRARSASTRKDRTNGT